MDCVNAVPTL